MLRCTILELHEQEWDKLLPYLHMYYNGTSSASTNKTPHEIVYGRNITLPGEIRPLEEDGAADFPAVDAHVNKLRAVQTATEANIRRAQNMQKKHADKKRRPANIIEGDFVLLEAKNLRLKIDASRKLLPRYVGPYQVISSIGSDAYKLALPASMKIHNVFHASLLKKYMGHIGEGDAIELEAEEEPEYEVEAILGHQVRPNG